MSAGALADRRQAASTDASSGRAFARLADDELATRLSAGDLAALFDHAEHREAGLAAARQGRFAEARAELAAARTLLRRSELSEDATLLATAALEPVEAYLEHRRGRCDAARELLLHASALDGELVRERGFVFPAAHRLQIAHNLLRLHCRLDERTEAVELAAAFLDYLELGVDCVPDSLACPRRYLDAVPGEILEFYFEAIAAEVAPFFAGRHDEETRRLFRPLGLHTLRGGCGGGSFGPQAHAWLELTSLALAGTPEPIAV